MFRCARSGGRRVGRSPGGQEPAGAEPPGGGARPLRAAQMLNALDLLKIARARYASKKRRKCLYIQRLAKLPFG